MRQLVGSPGERRDDGMQIIQCPTCLRRLQLPEDKAATSLQCPACQSEFDLVEHAAENRPTSTDFRVSSVDNSARRTESDDDLFSDDERRPQPLLRIKKPVGTTRRKLALIGFLGGVLFSIFGLSGPNGKDICPATAGAPLLGALFAGFGAALGMWIDVGLRLVNRKKGDSLLMTLARDDEAEDDP